MENAIILAVLLVLTVINGVFSMSETAVVSVRRIRLQQRAEAGDDRARAALELVKKPERFLSTVQVFITLIGIFAGAFGGEGLSKDVALWLQRLGMGEKSSQNLGLALVVALITYLSLVIGELVPKTLALNNAEGIAIRVAKPMAILSIVTAPIVSLLSVSTNGLLRIMGVKPSDEPPVTEDEIKLLIAQGTKAGVFAEEEQEIVEGVFRTTDRRVASLMTPRREIVYLDVEDPWEKNRAKIAAGHAAFPVCEGGMDNLLGIAVLKRMWEQTQAGDDVDLRAIAEKPLYVLESTRAMKALNAFKGAKQHIALIVDEYGGVVGLLTLHDLIEAMVGDLPDASGPVVNPEAVRREDGSWLLDGMLPMDEMVPLLDIRRIPEDSGEYASLGGFVMARLGRIPTVGDHFDWDGIRFEVLDMDGNRVDRVLATPETENVPTAAAQ
jgi:putative hemolysin